MADELSLRAWTGRVGEILPGHDVRVAGSGRPAGPWRSLRELSDPEVWPEIARAYAGGLGSRHQPVGASCALQGLSGRVAGPLIAGWTAGGRVPTPAPETTWVHVEHGRSTAVALAERTPLLQHADGTELAADVVQRIAPLVAAVRASSPVVERVLWGNVGAACAGAWRQAHRRHRDPDLIVAAEAFFAAPAWPWPPAIRCETWSDIDQSGPVFVHHRETCCLIHLAPDHAKCTPCSKLTENDRRSRWTESILADLRATS